MKRQRGRGGRKPNGQSNRHFESNGPDVKIRGTASHICEKYQQLARDASSSGDRVMAENYLQHAEHYFRVVQANQQAQPAPRPRDRVPGEGEANGAAPVNGESEATLNGDSANEQPSMIGDSGPMGLVAPETDALVNGAAGDGEDEPDKPARRPSRGRRPRAAAATAEATAEARDALDAASETGA